MSRKNSPKLELKLNLSPPRDRHMKFESSPPSSCESSCVSSGQEEAPAGYLSSPEVTSMVLVGCPRCLMYVMLSEASPKCPRCQSTVLLDFLNVDNTAKSRN